MCDVGRIEEGIRLSRYGPCIMAGDAGEGHGEDGDADDELLGGEVERGQHADGDVFAKKPEHERDDRLFQGPKMRERDRDVRVCKRRKWESGIR